MTPVYKLSASSITGRTTYGSMLAGNPAYELPGDYQSIATVTVGSGGASSVSFTSIPATYTHLQIRAIAKDNQSAHTDDGIYMYLNGDTGANYTRHSIVGDGATVAAYGSANTSIAAVGQSATSNASQNNVFAPNIIDILDYANTNKYKTIRALTGMDTNSSIGVIIPRSCLWRNTSAITSIELKSVGGTYNFVEYSTFALYGIKSA